MTFKFLEADKTPMPSEYGWAIVEHNDWTPPERKMTVRRTINLLGELGLSYNEDYKLKHLGWKTDRGHLVERIVFLSDEAFIMAKMML